MQKFFEIKTSTLLPFQDCSEVEDLRVVPTPPDSEPNFRR